MTTIDYSKIKFFLCPQCQAKRQKDERFCISCGLAFYKNDSPRFFGLGDYNLEDPHYISLLPIGRAQQSFLKRQYTKLKLPFLLVAFAFFMALAITGAQGILELLF